MARHRSPQGRRAHLTPPLTATAAAGAGGAHRPRPVAPTISSLPVRFVATAVAGGALAAVGQQALAQSLPAAEAGTNVLRLGVEQFLGAPAEAVDAAVPSAAVSTSPADPVTSVADPVNPAIDPPAGLLAPSSASAPAQPRVALAPVTAAPTVAETSVLDAAELVKATDIQRRLADAATRAAAKAAAAEEARAADKAADKAAARAKATADVDSRGKPDTSSLGGRKSGVQLVAGRVTSGFGARWGGQHKGFDIAAPIGTPIRVPLAGTVVDSGPASGFGLWVRVRHQDGSVTTYGHVNRSLVSEGQQVRAGQQIAEVGNRGRSTGPHLHMEVTSASGVKINPQPWLDQHGVKY